MAKTSASTSGNTTPNTDDKTTASDAPETPSETANHASDSPPKPPDTPSATDDTSAGSGNSNSTSTGDDTDTAADESGFSTETGSLTNPAELPVTDDRKKQKHGEPVSADDYPDTYVDDMQVELDAETADVLTRLYLQRRIEYQASYYEQRAIEYESNADLAFRAGAILMTLSSLLASIGVVSTMPIFAMLTALIPAMASFVATFRQLYQWDRQMSLYRDTLLGLERARILLPDPDIITPDDAKRVLPKLVQETESVLEQEVAQWGQIARGQGEDSSSAQAAFKDAYEAAMVNPDGSFDQAELDRVSGILDAGDSVPDSDALARLKPENVVGEESTLLAADATSDTDPDASDTQTAAATGTDDSSNDSMTNTNSVG